MSGVFFIKTTILILMLIYYFAGAFISKLTVVKVIKTPWTLNVSKRQALATPLKEIISQKKV